MKYAVISLGVLALAAFAAHWWWNRPIPDEVKFARLQAEVKPQGGVVFRTELQGKPAVFLLESCKLYRLTSGEREIERTQVLTTGFYLWFAGCMENTIRMENGLLRVYLRNMAFGAGGGNASGGEYRSRDGVAWEKEVSGKWIPVENAQD